MKNVFSDTFPRRWTTFPMIYGSNQIVAEIASWTNTTRIWLNDEIIDQKKGWRFDAMDMVKVSKVHEFCLPGGERVSLTLGYNLSDSTLFCSAEADGAVFYEKNFSETEHAEPPTETNSLIVLIPAWIAGGVIGLIVTQFFIWAL